MRYAIVQEGVFNPIIPGQVIENLDVSELDNVSITGTDYVDNIEYNVTRYFDWDVTYEPQEGKTLWQVYNPEGYTTHILTSMTSGPIYHYYRKDHLGNNREVWRASHLWNGNTRAAATVERTQYYPSGLPWASNFGDRAQSKKYNGKEWVEMHGLDEYDSEARWYYPAIMRTTTIDPLAEMYYSISPYAWCGNNPVSMVDPTGMSYDWVEREDKSVYFDPAAKNQATTKKNERYIGPTANLIDQNGNHHYGDQFGVTWSSTSLTEVTITAEMPSHIRDIQAGITMGIYKAQNEFINHPLTQGVLGVASMTFAPQFFVARTVASSTSAMFYASNIAGKTVGRGGLNLFKWGAEQTGKSTGWKAGNYMLQLPNKGTPALNWKANYGALRSEMNLGKPIFDSYRLPNGNLIPTGGFLNAKNLLYKVVVGFITQGKELGCHQ